jgi:small subunit ribosomal protein S6
MEETITMKTYEAMFLLEAGQGDFEIASEPIRTVLSRAGAEVLSINLWDERRLAYEIKGQKRGTYVLTYFKLDPAKVVELEHDCQLNDAILRVLIIRKDNLKDEELNAPTPAMIATAEREREAVPKTDETPQAEAEVNPAVEAVEAIQAAETTETTPSEEPVTE